MEFADILWMVVIVAASVYLLYRSVWKKKGHCTGCEGCSCPSVARMKTGSIQNMEKEKGNEKKSCC
jgi:hypothetical protein